MAMINFLITHMCWRWPKRGQSRKLQRTHKISNSNYEQ